MRRRVLRFLLPLALGVLCPLTFTGSAIGSTAKHHSRQRQRCQTKSRSRAATQPPGWGATWGWGWQAGSFLALENGRSAGPSGRARCGKVRSPAKHGVSTTAPTTGGAQGSTGSPTSGSGAQTEAPSTPAPVTTGGGGSGGGGGGETGESSTPPSIPHVQVTAVEYHFTLSRTSVPAGKVAFDFVNSGQDEHNLKVLSEEGSITGSFPDTVSKGVHDLTFEMRPGHYTLFCSLPEHESKGMKATLTVE